MSANLREAAFDLGTRHHSRVRLGPARLRDGQRRCAPDCSGWDPKDFGRPIQDLELSYRPVELRSHLDVVASELRSVEVKGIRWLSNGDARILDVRISPLLNDGTSMGTVPSPTRT